MLLRSQALCLALLFTILHTGAQRPVLVLPVGHTDNVVLINYSPDGKTVVTSSYDNTVKIWDARNGRLLYSLEGHNSWARSASFSPDSKTMVTAWDSTAQIWNVKTGKLLHTLKKEPNATMIVAGFSPDGKKIVTADENRDVIIWDGHTGAKLNYTKGHTNDLNDAHFSPDSKFIVTTGRESLVNIWDAKNGELFFALEGHSPTADVEIASFNPDSKYLASASSDHTVIIWDIYNAEISRRLEGHMGPVLDVNYSPDGNTIVTASEDNTAKIWDAKTGKLLHSLEGHLGKVEKALFSPDGKRIVTTCMTERNSKVWDVNTGRLLYTIGGKDDGINYAIFSPGNKYILAATIHNTAEVFESGTGRLLSSFKGHTETIPYVSISPDGKKMVAASADHTAKVWNRETGRIEHVLKGHTALVNTADFSPDGKMIITTSNDSTARLWDTRTGRLLYILRGHADWLYMAVFAPDSKTVVTTSFSNEPLIWDVQTGKMLCTALKGNGILESTHCYSSDGKTILTDPWNGDASLWEIKTGKVLLRIKNDEENRFYLSSFSPDNKRIFTADKNGLIRMWDAGTGELISELPANSSMITAFNFSPDGKIMVSTAVDQKVATWDIASGKLLHVLEGHQFPVTLTQFSPDNKTIATSTYFDHLLKLWDLQTGNLLKTVTFRGTMSAIDWKRKKIISHENSEVLLSDLETGNVLFSSVGIDQEDFITRAKDNYYEVSAAAARWLYWRKDGKLYDFDQWDMQYNRPDKILEGLGNKNAELLTAYKKAYQKRIRKMKIDTTMFREDYHAPITEILNRDILEAGAVSAHILVKIRCYETLASNRVEKILVTINGNPLYGIKGMSITKPATDTTLQIPVALSRGQNVIKVSCLNNRAAESLRETVYINYEPATALVPDTYFIGIGVSAYKDTLYNLRYADKDVKDIGTFVQQKYPGAFITLLTNEKVTLQNIKMIRDQLLKTKPDDRVIISLSGHGLIDSNYDFYFATYDMDFNNPSLKGLGYDDLEYLLDSIPARNKLVLMDACHSGELDKEGSYTITSMDKNVKEGKGFKVTSKDSAVADLQNTFGIMQELFANTGRSNGATIISAAAGTEFAYEGNNWANGVFTYSILQGLTQDNADADKNGFITVTELREYVSEEVGKLTNGLQRPTSRQINFDNNWQLW
ncbi:MAG: PQQ-binding-like beta-propeller repeat protein [Chitinophagaceae bacterium]